MLKVQKYSSIIENEFYLDSNEILRRTNDGYHGRYKANDEVIPYIDRDGYMKVQIPRIRGTIKTSHIRALLLGLPLNKSIKVDHIDGNKLNELSSNLRLVTQKVNSCNRAIRSDNTSGITGISWNEPKQRYIVRRNINGIRKATSRKTLADAIIALNELTKLDKDYTERHGK